MPPARSRIKILATSSRSPVGLVYAASACSTGLKGSPPGVSRRTGQVMDGAGDGEDLLPAWLTSTHQTPGVSDASHTFTERFVQHRPHSDHKQYWGAEHEKDSLTNVSI